MELNDSDPITPAMTKIPVGSIKKGKTIFLDSVEEDLKNIGLRGWRRKAVNREPWKDILQQACATER